MPAESKDFSSSMIASASYDSDSGEMTVQMRKNGREYVVPGIKPEEWADFQNSWSPGRWWHDHIKGRG